MFNGGNCVLWVFQKERNVYRVILTANMVQTLRTKATKSKGYLDIETTAHGSSTSGGIAVYRFDGTVYQVAECFDYMYERTGRFRNGQAITKDRPRLTRTECPDYTR